MQHPGLNGWTRRIGEKMPHVKTGDVTILCVSCFLFCEFVAFCLIFH